MVAEESSVFSAKKILCKKNNNDNNSELGRLEQYLQYEDNSFSVSVGEKVVWERRNSS